MYVCIYICISCAYTVEISSQLSVSAPIGRISLFTYVWLCMIIYVLCIYYNQRFPELCRAPRLHDLGTQLHGTQACLKVPDPCVGQSRLRNRWGKCEKMWLEALVVFGSTWFISLTHPLPSAPSWSNGVQRWASGHSRPGRAQRPLYTFRELQDVCPCKKSSIFCWRVKSIRRSPCLKYLSIN